jgi:hypothetical protein
MNLKAGRIRSKGYGLGCLLDIANRIGIGAVIDIAIISLLFLAFRLSKQTLDSHIADTNVVVADHIVATVADRIAETTVVTDTATSTTALRHELPIALLHDKKYIQPSL